MRYLVSILLMLNLGQVYANLLIQGGPALMAVESSRSETENKFYAGLVWELGEKFSFQPDLPIGVRSLNVNSSDHVDGSDLSVRLSFKNNRIDFHSIRLSYLNRQRSLIGNVSVGYQLSSSSIFGSVAAQSEFSRLGLDFHFVESRMKPYLELLSLDNPSRVSPGIDYVAVSLQPPQLT